MTRIFVNFAVGTRKEAVGPTLLPTSPRSSSHSPRPYAPSPMGCPHSSPSRRPPQLQALVPRASSWSGCGFKLMRSAHPTPHPPPPRTPSAHSSPRCSPPSAPALGLFAPLSLAWARASPKLATWGKNPFAGGGWRLAAFPLANALWAARAPPPTLARAVAAAAPLPALFVLLPVLLPVRPFGFRLRVGIFDVWPRFARRTTVRFAPRCMSGSLRSPKRSLTLADGLNDGRTD